MKKDICELVYDVLLACEPARKDDFILFGWVCKKLGVDLNKSFKEILLTHKKLGMPSFESVTRARRKVFETYPELNEAKTIREEEREKYLEKFGKNA